MKKNPSGLQIWDRPPDHTIPYHTIDSRGLYAQPPGDHTGAKIFDLPPRVPPHSREDAYEARVTSPAMVFFRVSYLLLLASNADRKGSARKSKVFY